MNGADHVADATGNWVDRSAPTWTRPYLRLMRADRPIGSWLLLLPCWWSTALAAIAAGTSPNVRLLGLFAVGAVTMRGAGCVWNDILDRDLDARVERTRGRPLPSGQVSLAGAVILLLILAAAGLLVLLQMNAAAIAAGAASLAVVALYPLAKRVTFWPQAVLGLAFSWGALMGWVAVFGRLDLPALLLYAGSILWVIGYDTIYAHQDREDDAIIGIRSTARLFGQATRMAVALSYLGAVLLLGLAGWAAGASGLFVFGLATFAVHLAWQVWRLDIDDAENCLKVFRSNRDAGLILFAALALDAVLNQGR